MKALIKKIIPARARLALRRKQFELRAKKYPGTEVYCPCCNREFSQFLPYGYREIRENAACPRCNSLERMRLLWFYLERELQIFDNWKDQRILHFAPEWLIEKKLRRHPGYLSIDIMPELAMVQGDIQQLQFDKDSFDLVICSHVLDLIPDEDLAFKELHRVLKPHGVLLIQQNILSTLNATVERSDLPLSEFESLVNDGDPHHQREYGPDFPDRIRNRKFEVEIVDYYNDFSEEDRLRYGLKNEPIYSCRPLLKK